VQLILALAESCQSHGVLSKVDVVSTVGVAGRTAGLIPERPMPEVENFHNTYEAAKAEAEKIVLAQWGRGLPITIHRPSMVVGDARTGKIIHFQVFYHLCEFLSGQPTLGLVIKATDATLDIIPVDYVARAIHWANCHPDTAGHIFHLCSGPEDAIKIPALMVKVRDFMSASGTRLPRLYPIPSTCFRALLPVMALFTPQKVRRAMRTLPLFLDYLDEPQTFANSETKKFFAPAGIRVPPVDTYLETILAYYYQMRSPGPRSAPASAEA
jgi:nucleoside-diphosphate-sugar epimerase